jgi:hypothetical protein
MYRRKWRKPLKGALLYRLFTRMFISVSRKAAVLTDHPRKWHLKLNNVS